MRNQKYRTGLKRVAAAIVDCIVFLPLLLLEQWIYKSTTNTSILFLWAIVIYFLPLLYSIILHYRTGQTIGKWVAGVKVLDITETRLLTLKQSIFRDGFYLLVAIIAVSYYGILFQASDNKEDLLTDFRNFSDNPVFFWTVLQLITMFTNTRRRGIHDYMAKSIVVITIGR
jgi:uncharacterized RDD family membrane protein YckC